MHNFLTHRIDSERATDNTPLVFRFPPEPNGYLHLGHVKSIMLHDMLAERYGAELNLRYDDTNPKKENEEYVRAIERDARWLSSRFTRVVWTSNYFGVMYECALALISKGLAYIDFNDAETMRTMRGSFNEPGVESEHRNASPEFHLEWFHKMSRGEVAENAMVLRAKIDMAHPNMTMRDPVIYRVCHTPHHATGDTWKIYPMYDFAHPISDAIEHITYSLCTLEFEDHRPLYDWVIHHCHELLNHTPHQMEFARLDVEGVVLSKRKLHAVVERGEVNGWEDPRMPTVGGLRARGYTPAMLRLFVERCGVSKVNSVITNDVLEGCVADVLGPVAERRLAIAEPVVMHIRGLTSTLNVEMPNHPKDPARGHRGMTLPETIWVDKADVRLHPEANFWRIAPGNWVRLKHGLNVYIEAVLEKEDGSYVVEAVADMPSVNIKAATHKAKATLHWLNPEDAVERLRYHYGDLLDEEGHVSPEACRSKSIWVEKSMPSSTHYEFERMGYFWVDATGHVHELAKLGGAKKML